MSADWCKDPSALKAVTPIQESDVAVILQRNSLFSGTMQKAEVVEQLGNNLFRGDRDEATSVIMDALAEGKLQLSSMHWVGIKKRMLDILDLVDFDRDVYELVCRCFKAMDVNGRSQVVVIAFVDFEFVVLLQGWRQGGW